MSGLHSPFSRNTDECHGGDPFVKGDLRSPTKLYLGVCLMDIAKPPGSRKVKKAIVPRIRCQLH